MLCIFSICTYAQQITVSGTVTDAENNPLIGAAVLVLELPMVLLPILMVNIPLK